MGIHVQWKMEKKEFVIWWEGVIRKARNPIAMSGMSVSVGSVAKWKLVALGYAKMMDFVIKPPCDQTVQICQVIFKPYYMSTFQGYYDILNEITNNDIPWAQNINILLEKCECGDSCEMKDGEEGICHKGGWCKPATMEPDCESEGKLWSMIAKIALLSL